MNMNMNMFDVEAGRPIVDRYVLSELLDDHLDHIISVHSAVSYPWLTTLTVHVLQYNWLNSELTCLPMVI